MSALQNCSLNHDLKYQNYKHLFEEFLQGDTSSLLEQHR